MASPTTDATPVEVSEEHVNFAELLFGVFEVHSSRHAAIESIAVKLAEREAERDRAVRNEEREAIAGEILPIFYRMAMEARLSASKNRDVAAYGILINAEKGIAAIRARGGK